MSLAALTDALGHALNDLNGLRSTRVAAGSTLSGSTIDFGIPTDSGRRHVRDYNGASATSATLISVAVSGRRAIHPSIAGGQTFRGTDLIEGDLEAAVVARTSDTVIEVASGTFAVRHKDMRWEVFTGSNTVAVESTIGWPTAGVFACSNGSGLPMLFRYSGKTPTTFTGVEFNVNGIWLHQLPGAGIFADIESPFTVGRELIDASRSMSAADLLWRSFIVRYATGEDLTVLGRTLGVKRPAGAGDTLYRAVIRAVALAPHGTMRAIRLFLDTLYGRDGYEVFEDLTSTGRTTAAAWYDPYVRPTISNPAIVFLRVIGRSDEFVGKAFIEGEERAFLTTLTTAPLPTSPYIDLVDVRLENEGEYERVLEGTTDLTLVYTAATQSYAVTSTGTPFTAGVAVTGTATTVDLPLLGDELFVDYGQGYRRVGPVALRTSTSAITIRTVAGFGRVVEDLAGSPLRWYIARRRTTMLNIFPSQDVRYEGGVPIDRRQYWNWEGSGSGDETNFVPSASGLAFSAAAADQIGFYISAARILPQSIASMSMRCRVTTADTDATNVMQFGMVLADGNAAVAVGCRADGAGNVEFALSAPTAFIVSTDQRYGFGAPKSIPLSQVVHLEIVKVGELYAELYVDGRLTHRVGYSELFSDTFGTISAGGNYRAFGRVQGGALATPVAADIYHVDWNTYTGLSAINRTDFVLGTTGASGAVGSGLGIFPPTVGMVGDYVFLDRDPLDLTPQVTNAWGGTSEGVWVLTAYSSVNSMTAAYGPTLSGLDIRTRGSNTAELQHHDLVYPHSLGHIVELLTGPNAGAQWRITALLDDFGNVITSGAAHGDPDRVATTRRAARAQLTRVSGATVLDAQFGSRWRLRSEFPVDAYRVHVLDQATLGGSVTLPQNFPIPVYTPGGLISPYTGAATVLPEGKGPLLRYRVQRVRSAHVVGDATVANATNAGPGYDYYPFYLYDPVGWGREVLDIITAAGVHVDYTRFYRDAQGPHV